MSAGTWLLYRFPGDDHAAIGAVIPGHDWESVRWAWHTVHNVALNGRRDALTGTWYCEARR